MENTIRIELGQRSQLRPCDKHKDDGFEPTCNDCRIDSKDVPELKNFWVELRDPRHMAYGRRKELYASASDTACDQHIAAGVQPGCGACQGESGKARQERWERIAAGSIVAWNLTDVETGEQLQVPAGDVSVLDRALNVVDPIAIELQLLGLKQESVPKESATS